MEQALQQWQGRRHNSLAKFNQTAEIKKLRIKKWLSVHEPRSQKLTRKFIKQTKGTANNLIVSQQSVKQIQQERYQNKAKQQWRVSIMIEYR